ncbi:amino acid adenylation domain-containing protein [Streptomyces sp. NPDC007905]|uniref:amino acid adenylation domain-containing protein n=1 Tax=Streptomyces sp. NPDC007905 TaxID=3364788 RepID=UPI0036EFF844
MQPKAEWAAGRPSAAPDEGLHETFARLARARPDAVALIEGERALTYGELDRTADAWAARLATAGAGPGDLVPVLLPRGTDLVAALLAVLKTGAAYALLDPAWPEHRLGDIRAQLDPPLVVADAGTRPPLPPLPVWSPPRGSRTTGAPPGFRPAAVHGSDPACVFFTSGTTGRPKGVVSPHRGTARLFPPDGFASFTAGTVMALAAAVSWDAFSLELWSVLLNGGTSLIIDEPYLSPTALRAGVDRHGMNTVWLTSSLFNMVVDEDPDAFRGLRQVLVGGERLSVSHVRRFLRRHPGITLLNGYGPVESTVFATTHRVTEADCELPGGIPLGRPVPGTQLYVVAPDGTRPCAVGETGELHVAGDGLALGYLGAPALTAEKFARLPLGPATDGTRVYRTGDLVEWGTDGLLHYRGRADGQVKIRGHRVEPAEVERQVEQLLPAVRTCRVLARPDASGTSLELVAFCTPERPGDPLTGALPALHKALVPYQRPTLLVSVDGFPTTDRGKLDERALLARAEDVPGTLTPGPAPDGAARDGGLGTDPLVQAVAETFAAVLGRAAVPPDVPFAELGGTSLGAGRVCARLADRLGRPVPVSQFYLRPTVTALADWLRDTAGAPAPETPAADGATPLTPLQIVYLTRHLLEPADRTSHCLLTWRIGGEPDRAALHAAVTAVHLRHEALRAAYVADPGPSAVLVDIPPPDLEVLPEEPSVDAAVRALREELADALDLTGGEVWRTALVPVAASDTTVFGCVVHHIAFDGWSESVLARDLGTAYAAALPRPRLRPDGRGPDRAGTPAAPAAPPPSLHRLHAERTLRRTLTEPDAHRSYLVDELTGVPELRWPPDPAEPVSLGRGSTPGRVTAHVAASVLATVDSLAAECGVTRFVALLALWARTVAEVTGQRDFAVGVPVAQRDGAALEDVVGCHITMLCLRLRGTALGGGAAALRATGRIVARAFAAQDVPFGDVLTLVDPPRTGRPPLYQALFALQDNPVPELELPGLHSTFLRQPYLDLPLELHTECWPDGSGGLRVETAYRPDAVPPAAAREIAERFSDLLHRLGRPGRGGAVPPDAPDRRAGQPGRPVPPALSTTGPSPRRTRPATARPTSRRSPS